MLKALGRGLSNKEIAQSLHISVDTERKHMMSILSKLGVRSRLQALASRCATASSRYPSSPGRDRLVCWSGAPSVQHIGLEKVGLYW